MTYEPFTTLRSKTIVLAHDNIDTDQIIPARFLTTTSREGLGKFAFYDWRYDGQGEVLEHSPLNHFSSEDHRILVAGSNFGCGSSREHAPWALHDFGFRAVISSDIADIFTSNALKNGVLPIVVDQEVHQFLLENPGTVVTIDLNDQLLLIGNKQVAFTVEAFARQCLLNGVDTLGALMNNSDAISAYEVKNAARIAR